MPVASETDQRVMRFFPAATDRPTQHLSADQVALFNRQGFIPRIPVFTPTQAEANRAAFDHLLALFRAAGKDSYAINGFHGSCASIWDLVTNPLILDCVQDLLGEHFIAWGTHFFCKMPNDGKAVSWHQDAPYWPLSPTHTVTAWIAIDDADESNAAMRVIPGSHLLGPLPTRPSKPEENNVLGTSLDQVERIAAPVSLNLRAGEMSLHSDLLVHGSLPNPGPRRRCGLTIRYATVDVRSDKGWNQNAILCRGHDPAGYWRVRPRPVGESPFSDHKTIGAN